LRQKVARSDHHQIPQRPFWALTLANGLSKSIPLTCILWMCPGRVYLLRNALHHPVIRTLTAHIDVAVICVVDVSVSPAFQFAVEFIAVNWNVSIERQVGAKN
jgi:hypothetical protein